MAGDGAVSGQRLPKRKTEFQYVIEALKEQWGSMVAMMLMFIGTIGLGMLLQPFYNQSDDLRAFGKEGASQGRWILLELVMIFAFTAAIIWLAKKKKEWVIKIGILIILWFALVYSTVPLAHLILAPDMDPEPFVYSDRVEEGSDFVIHLGATGYMMYEVAPLLNETGEALLNSDNISLYSHSLNAITASGYWNWSVDLATAEHTLRITDQADAFVVSAGQDLWLLDRSGQQMHNDSCLRATSPAGCTLSFNHSVGGERNYTYTITDESRLIRFDPFGKGNLTNPVKDAQWKLPLMMDFRDGQLVSKKVAEGRMLLVSTKYASLIIIPEQTSGEMVPGRDIPVDHVEEVWNHSLSGEEVFTAAEWGISPWAQDNLSSQSGNEMMLVLGTSAGDVLSWNFNLTEDLVEAEGRMKMADNDAVDGPIHALRLGDYGDGGWNELFIAGGDTLYLFHGKSLTDYMHIDLQNSPDAIQIIPNDDGVFVSWHADGNWSGGQLNDEMLIRDGLQLDPTSTYTGLLVATLLMAWLIWRPEWYVVNTTGILVGSGVVVMLGIAFVPWLVIIFMVLAAIYDHWAVHKSKHMLDLADTMIGLNLPILLVAPQGKGYSMLEEKSSKKKKPSEESEDVDDVVVQAVSEEKGFKAKAASAEKTRTEGKGMKAKEEGAEAMFMGLGDIIFPGMLVISAMTYLAPIGGSSAAFWVAIGVLVGGLLGYLVLMTRVALGIPQAGLPLLNGGSILGYIVVGLLLIGWKALEFNITL